MLTAMAFHLLRFLQKKDRVFRFGAYRTAPYIFIDGGILKSRIEAAVFKAYKFQSPRKLIPRKRFLPRIRAFFFVFWFFFYRFFSRFVARNSTGCCAGKTQLGSPDIVVAVCPSKGCSHNLDFFGQTAGRPAKPVG